MAVDVNRIEGLARQLLEAIGEDPSRPALLETPRRYAAWWAEFINYDPGKTETAFAMESSDQMVVVSGMRVWSMCEHHLLPFWADVAIGYVASGRILGLSKFARIAQKYAHRLQVQERLTHQIADEIQSTTGSPDVAVLATGEHLCMLTRGVRSGGLMTSSVMRGVFRDSASARAEFLALARNPRPAS